MSQSLEQYGLIKGEAGRRLDRTDPKWAHPAIREGWPLPGDDAIYTQLYATGLSPEDRAAQIEAGKKFSEPFENMPLMPGFPQEWIDFSERTDVEIPGLTPDAPTVHLEVHVPKGAEGQKLPVIMHIPSGGLLNASAPMFRSYGLELAAKHNAVVAVPSYRHLPEFGYPAPIDDCHAAYAWLVDNPDGLPIDTDNMTISGISTGAQVALSLAFRLKGAGFAPRGIIAHNPIVDDRMDTPSMRTDTYTSDWNGVLIKECGAAYLGPADAGNDLLGPEAYANYATVEDCKGLAPVFILTTEFDPDRDHNQEFLRKLQEAGVFCEYYMRGGGGHSASAIFTDTAEDWNAPTKYLWDEMHEDCLRYDLRRPWTAE